VVGRYGVTRPWSEREIELCCRLPYMHACAERKSERARERERECMCERARE